jgi:hypothetical protein
MAPTSLSADFGAFSHQLAMWAATALPNLSGRHYQSRLSLTI